jgi:Uncharacterized alpha/beta hydrolase domain (DUF2235)
VKNIVILSDGTGQGASMPKAERTNVWKLWDATRRKSRSGGKLSATLYQSRAVIG